MTMRESATTEATHEAVILNSKDLGEERLTRAQRLAHTEQSFIQAEGMKDSSHATEALKRLLTQSAYPGSPVHYVDIT